MAYRISFKNRATRGKWMKQPHAYSTHAKAKNTAKYLKKSQGTNVRITKFDARLKRNNKIPVY